MIVVMLMPVMIMVMPVIVFAVAVRLRRVHITAIQRRCRNE